MAEWSKALVLKTSVGETLPGVRIPPHPLSFPAIPTDHPPVPGLRLDLIAVDEEWPFATSGAHSFTSSGWILTSAPHEQPDTLDRAMPWEVYRRKSFLPDQIHAGT